MCYRSVHHLAFVVQLKTLRIYVQNDHSISSEERSSKCTSFPVKRFTSSKSTWLADRTTTIKLLLFSTHITLVLKLQIALRAFHVNAHNLKLFYPAIMGQFIIIHKNIGFVKSCACNFIPRLALHIFPFSIK